jgi:cation:H+ antiporter
MSGDIVTFAVSLAVLLLAARFFTISSERIGLALGMSPFAIGVLIVAAGTSLPEMVASVIAVTEGVSEIVVGNVLGANLSNLLLVTAVVAVAAPRQVKLGDQYILIDLHFLLGSALVLALSLRDGAVTRVEAAFLLATYAAYLLYLMKEGKIEKDLTLGVTDPAAAAARRFPWTQVAVVLVAGAFIYLGARFTVGSLASLAERMGVPPSIVAVTILSVGTTLPELIVSATAARSGKAEVAIGNILGSCVFNALGVVGVSSLVGRVVAPAELLSLPLPVFGAAALLFYLLTLDKRISRWEGLLFLIVYGLFVMEVARLA